MTPDQPLTPAETPAEFEARIISAGSHLKYPIIAGAEEGDETEAPTDVVESDQPADDAPTDDVTPDDSEESGTTDADEAPEGSDADESADGATDTFTDVDLDSLSDEERGRYEQMQADYTRKTQALAEQRAELESVQSFVSDLVADTPSEEQKAMQEQVFKALAERLGYQLEGDEDEGTDGDAEEGENESDEPEFRDPRVDALLAEREEKAEAERAAAFEKQLDVAEENIENGLKALAEKDGVELTDKELDLLFDKVLALPPVDGNEPDVQGAYKALQEVLNVNKQRWIDSKKADPAPDGTAGGDKPDLSTPEGRQANLARIVQASQGRQDQ